jgi:uncharacterized membrane protein YfbV (UPF0208 family)
MTKTVPANSSTKKAEGKTRTYAEYLGVGFGHLTNELRQMTGTKKTEPEKTEPEKTAVLTAWQKVWDRPSREAMVAGVKAAFAPYFAHQGVKVAAALAVLGAACWAVDRWKKIQKKKKDSGERLTEDEERRFEKRLRDLKKAKAELEDAAYDESERDGDHVHELLKGMERGEAAHIRKMAVKGKGKETKTHRTRSSRR